MTSKSPVGDISVVTLIRTDTTLHHSQKAEKVWPPDTFKDKQNTSMRQSWFFFRFRTTTDTRSPFHISEALTHKPPGQHFPTTKHTWSQTELSDPQSTHTNTHTGGHQTRSIASGKHGIAACWAEAPIKIARMTLTIKLDRNWSSFQLANSAPPLSVTDSAIAPSARMSNTVLLKL